MSLPVPNRFTLTLASAIALSIVGCGGSAATLPPAVAEGSAVTPEVPISVISESEALVWLVAPTGVFQEGWSRIWEESDSLFVEIDVFPPEAVAQPAHIHQGKCTQLGVIDHRLANVIGGHSLSELPGVSLRDVATGGLAINLHLSFADFSTFTACGEIPVLVSPGQSGLGDSPESDFSDPDY